MLTIVNRKRRAIIDKCISSSIVKLRLNSFPSFLLTFFMKQFVVHNRDHLVWFCIVRVPPISLCTIVSLLNRFPLICLLLIIFLDTRVSMHPVHLVLLTFICIRLFMWLSLWMKRFMSTMSTDISFQLSDLLLVVIVLWL